MNSRSYQTDFYNHYDLLQDNESRYQKAEKILALISAFNKDLNILRCLDLGCSSGFITSTLQPYFKQMVGLDFDPAGLEAIPYDKKNLTGFIRGDAMLLPFPEDSFDVIICAQVYEHVLDDKILFSEISRIISDDGIIFFSGPNKLFPIEPHYKLPFIHWIPLSWADNYLRLFKKGVYFDIRSRTYYDLKNQFKDYIVYDMTRTVLRNRNLSKNKLSKFLISALLKLPIIFWRVLLLPLIPNVNWVLIKHKNRQKENSFYVRD